MYLLWGILNIGLFVYFIVLCFGATKFIREKIGYFAAIIFALGLLSFVGHTNNDSDNKEPNSNQIKTWKFASEDSLQNNAGNTLDIHLEKTLISRYSLGINYRKGNKGQLNIPISAYSLTTGITIGTIWKPNSIIVNATTDNNKFEYFVSGVVEWKLFGTTIYYQAKNYKGIASID